MVPTLRCTFFLSAALFCVQAQPAVQEKSQSPLKKSAEIKQAKKKSLKERFEQFSKGLGYSSVLAFSTLTAWYMVNYNFVSEYYKNYYDNAILKRLKPDNPLNKECFDKAWRETYRDKPARMVGAILTIAALFYANYDFKIPQKAYTAFKNVF